MKRKTLIYSLISLFCGAALCAACLLWIDTPIDPLLCGLGGAGIGSGIVMLGKYIYWTLPQHAAHYQQAMEEEEIELHDERKQHLRDKAGRYSYIIGLFTICASIVVIAVFGHLELLPGTHWVLLYLSVYLVVQYILGIFIYQYLNRKY